MSNAILHPGEWQIPHRLPKPESRLGKFALYALPYVALYAIAVALIAMTDHDPASAKGAWNYFIPLIGVISGMSGWTRYAGDRLETRARFILRQIFHWAALLLVIHLLFLPDVQHFLRAEDDGFVIVYLVGLASIMAGIYLDWKMGLFGLFLIFSGVIIAFLDDNALLIAVGGLATMAVIVTAFAWIRFHQRLESAGG
jgi:hypothetical protein